MWLFKTSQNSVIMEVSGGGRVVKYTQNVTMINLGCNIMIGLYKLPVFKTFQNMGYIHIMHQFYRSLSLRCKKLYKNKLYMIKNVHWNSIIYVRFLRCTVFERWQCLFIFSCKAIPVFFITFFVWSSVFR